MVEFDGDSHAGQEENDRIRQQFLESNGLVVLRFWNVELFDQPDAVTETIYGACATRVADDPRFTSRLDEWGQFTPNAPKGE